MLEHGAPAVRVGLHHGPAVEDEGDYFGATVNLAARVSALATGGEVLVTGSTAALVPELDGVFYESRGRQTLKNVAEPVEVFAALRLGSLSGEALPVDPVCRMAVDLTAPPDDSCTTATPISSARSAARARLRSSLTVTPLRAAVE